MISVILPTYNEKDNIIYLINSIIKIFDELGDIQYEIIVVDDNSPDGTSKEVNNNKNNENVKVITRRKERGLAGAIKTGIINSTGEHIIVMDTDLSHPPEFIKTLINTLFDLNLDIVIASRYIQGGKMLTSKYKYILSNFMNYLVGIIINLKLKDLTGGFFIMKKSILNSIDIDKVFIGYGDYFFRLFYALKEVRYSYKEIPFTYEHRRSGESKTRTFHMGLEYIKTAFSLRFKK
jgi:dolichol-phosphate mannosyltransferase